MILRTQENSCDGSGWFGRVTELCNTSKLGGQGFHRVPIMGAPRGDPTPLEDDSMISSCFDRETDIDWHFGEEHVRTDGVLGAIAPHQMGA